MKPPNTRARGRPRQDAVHETEMRERIVTVARELFLRDGVAAVSMRNIASEVGCSPMWLYRYFSNKQEILWQVWDVFLGELFVRLEAVEAETPRARLEQIALAGLAYWLEYPERFCMVFLQEDLVPDATRQYVEGSAFVARFDLITRIIEEAQAQGDLRAATATEIAQGLLCLLQGLALNLITISGYAWCEPERLARVAVGGYLAGLSGDR